jgi:hypothetical protein
MRSETNTFAGPRKSPFAPAKVARVRGIDKDLIPGGISYEDAYFRGQAVNLLGCRNGAELVTA